MPKMTHPDSRKRIDVAPAQVAMYESQGWRTAAVPKKKTSAQTNNRQAPAATDKE